MPSIVKPLIPLAVLSKNDLGLTIRDYEGAMSTLCAGCGHDSVTAAIVHAFWELSTPPHMIAKLSGIGCSSKTPTYFVRGAHGFNSAHGRMAQELAEQEKVDIRLHSIIYELQDEIKRAMTGLLEPIVKETYMGRAEVRDTFRVPKIGVIAGCLVVDGVVKRDAEVRLLRDNVMVFKGKIGSVRRFKEDVTEVRNGMECGLSITNYGDIKVGDIIEVFVTERVAAEAFV